MNSVVATNICKRYGSGAGSRDVLIDASLRVDAGKSLAIMGPSGAGKSTLLNIIGTLDHADAGSVNVFGCDPAALNEKNLAAFRSTSIGFIFQSHHLLPQCSILENVLLPTIVTKKNALERAKRLIERVGLTHRMVARPAMLSGGECQRAAVVRALINEPRLLLADEPTGSLDRISADAIGALLAEMVREEHAALITVTHSPELAARMDATLELRDGRLHSPDSTRTIGAAAK